MIPGPLVRKLIIIFRKWFVSLTSNDYISRNNAALTPVAPFTNMD